MSTKRRSVLGLLGAAPLGAAGAMAAARPAYADSAGDSAAERARPIPADLRPGGALDLFISEQARTDRFSGTVLLTYQGRTVLSRSVGMADQARSIRNEPNTLFALASVTKLFTAVAVHQLAQSGAVAYHAKLGDYLGGQPAAIADLPLHHLLTHTSGLGNYRETQAFKDGARSWASAAEVNDGILAIIRQSPSAFTPGSRFAYSNSAYELLGAMVAQVSGQPYYDYVRERIFRPAGMTATDWYTRPQWAQDRRIAHPYAEQPSGGRTDVLADAPFIGTAAGDAFSTARDMEKFARAVTGGRLLGPAATTLLLSGKLALPRWSDTPDTPAPQAAYQGYGPLALLLGDQWIFLHNGGSAGEGTYVEMYPRTGWVSVVLGNYGIATGAAPVAVMARKLITARHP